MAYRALFIAITCLFLLAHCAAVRELVIIEKPQPAQHVEGTVFDPSGAPVPDMTVTDRSEQASVFRQRRWTDRDRDAGRIFPHASMSGYKAVQGTTLRIVDGEYRLGFYQEQEKEWIDLGRRCCA